MNIGKRIKEERERLGLSVDDVADALGKNRSTVYRYESNDIEKLPTNILEPLAKVLKTTPAYLMGWEDDNTSDPQSRTDAESNVIFLDEKNVYMVPLFESVSAGFGAAATNEILEYVPCYIQSEAEAVDTLCIRVKGDSMFPKIEEGDIIQVQKQTSVDSGSIAVMLLDKTEGLVKKVIYNESSIELHSFNPMYPVMKFEGRDVLRLEVVGLVKKIIKNV